MKRFILLASLLLITLTACEEPRLDPINEQRIEASLKLMRESLNEEKQTKLDRALKRVALMEAAKKDSDGGVRSGQFGEKFRPRVAMVQVIGHKTADEIIEYASHDSSQAEKMRGMVRVIIEDRQKYIEKVDKSIAPAKERLQTLLDMKEAGNTQWAESQKIHLSGLTLGPRQIHGPTCQCIGFNMVVDNQSEHTLAAMHFTFVIRDKATDKQLESGEMTVAFFDNMIGGPGVIEPGNTLNYRKALEAGRMLLPKDLSTLEWEGEIDLLMFSDGSSLSSPFGSGGIEKGIEAAESDLKRLEDNKQNALDAIRHSEEALDVLDFSKG